MIVEPLPGIGDLIWHLPHIHAIAKVSPGRKVSLLVKPRTQADQLLCADPAVDRVYWLNRNPGHHDGIRGVIRLARSISDGAFTTVWILHGSWRYGIAARLAGVPNRIGYGGGLQRWFVNRASPLPGSLARRHPVDQATKLLELNGLPVDDKEPRLAVCEQANARIHRKFENAPKPWIALGIGSSEPYKQWGRDKFGDLAARLAALGKGSLFLIGGPAEKAMGAWLERRVRESGAFVENAVGSSIQESVAITAACRAFVGNDTGFLNIAAALSVDAVGLFGGSPPLAYSSRIVGILPRDRAAGMNGIDVDQVLEALRGIGAV